MIRGESMGVEGVGRIMTGPFFQSRQPRQALNLRLPLQRPETPADSQSRNDFTLPDSLPDGAYTISAQATDNVKNSNGDPLTVILDNTGPQLTKTVGTPKYVSGPDTYVKSTTDISVVVNDGGSGLAGCTLSGDT